MEILKNGFKLRVHVDGKGEIYPAIKNKSLDTQSTITFPFFATLCNFFLGALIRSHKQENKTITLDQALLLHQ